MTARLATTALASLLVSTAAVGCAATADDSANERAAVNKFDKELNAFGCDVTLTNSNGAYTSTFAELTFADPSGSLNPADAKFKGRHVLHHHVREAAPVAGRKCAAAIDPGKRSGQGYCQQRPGLLPAAARATAS